ncbi:MAG: sucrase ferredoxin [Acidimicrobiales bacterium]
MAERSQPGARPGAGRRRGPAVQSCSEWARSQKLDPVGTAGRYRGFLLVEQPLPWPANVSDASELTELVDVAARAELRVQLVRAVGDQKLGDPADGVTGSRTAVGQPDDGLRRLRFYRQPQASPAKGTGWAGTLVLSEVTAPVGVLARVAAEVLAERPADPCAGGRGAGRTDRAGPVDVLVCTHGRRDACCGSLGTGLVASLREQPLERPPGQVRLWRTSHTGGHRFAPTAIVLPSATVWARADAALLEKVVNANGPLDDVLPRFRGSACLGWPAQQALERAVLAEVGWALLRCRRRALDLGQGRARLETEGLGSWDAVVSEGRRVPQPECRTDPALARKFSVEWLVEDLHRVCPG